MGHSSINEDFKGLDVQQEFELAKLYRQATADAAFLRNLSMKQDSAVSVPFRSSSVGHQEYALYRQKYLVMCNPFKTSGEKEDKKSMKKKINEWFIVNIKKENTKTTEPKSNKDKSSSSAGLSVLRFLRFLRWANGDESGKDL